MTSPYCPMIMYGYYTPHCSKCFMRSNAKTHFTTEEAIQIAEVLGINFDKFDVEQYRMGLDVELEHGRINPFTNITNDDPILTGKITLAHLNELPDYYTRLAIMENEDE